MLKLEDEDEDFCTGRSRFSDRLTAGAEPTAKIYVKVEPAGLGRPILAQLDTGAPYSILDPETAEAVDVPLEGQRIRLRTADGLKEGRLVRHPITLLADDGDSLDLNTLFFVAHEAWPAGKTFLGYNGFLDTIRIALDAQVNHFYFGPSPGRDA